MVVENVVREGGIADCIIVQMVGPIGVTALATHQVWSRRVSVGGDAAAA